MEGQDSQTRERGGNSKGSIQTPLNPQTPPPLFLCRPGAHTLERQRRWEILVTVTAVLFRRLMEPQAPGALLLRASRFLLNL